MDQSHDAYYIPSKSYWPFVAAVVMFTTMFGAAHLLNAPPGDSGFGKTVLIVGVIGVLGMFFGWFRSVINESLAGNYNHQVDTSFRMGMMWFIFSEVMFFGAFFGALFYIRMFSIPWLGGEGHGVLTHEFLWSDYAASWGSNAGNGPQHIGGAFRTVAAWGLPLLNTLILLSSSVTITIAHHALRAGPRSDHAQRRVRFDVLHAHRLPRSACHARHDHAGGDLVPRTQRSFQQRAPLRFRSRGLVLALCRRGLARALHVRLHPLSHVRTS
jgi:hypothetical protein